MTGPPNAGHCLFRSLPKNPTDYEAPDAEHLRQLQWRGEFQWFRKAGVILILDAKNEDIANIAEGVLTVGPFKLEAIELD